jgi:predicted RNA-binding Zn-ribbon protein involved in translation (DUF1610 family)
VDDSQITTAFETIIVIQYVAPLLLGGPLLVPSIFDKVTARSDRNKSAEAAAIATDGKTLAPLSCPSCGAAVPLESASFPCPHCHAQITPPDEYVRTFALRERATLRLKRAERKWRWSRWTSSPLVTIPLRLLFIAWFLAVAAAGLSLDWPTPVLVIANVLAGLELAVGLFYTSFYAKARKTMPALPAIQFLKAPASSGACTGCGAPIQFPADTFAALCMYCGADNYREALAKSAQADADAQVAVAKKSLLDATNDLDDRRGELVAFLGMMVVAELVYGVVLLLGMASDAIFGS